MSNECAGDLVECDDDDDDGSCVAPGESCSPDSDSGSGGAVPLTSTSSARLSTTAAAAAAAAIPTTTSARTTSTAAGGGFDVFFVLEAPAFVFLEEYHHGDFFCYYYANYGFGWIWLGNRCCWRRRSEWCGESFRYDLGWRRAFGSSGICGCSRRRGVLRCSVLCRVISTEHTIPSLEVSRCHTRKIGQRSRTFIDIIGGVS